MRTKPLALRISQARGRVRCLRSLLRAALLPRVEEA